jgi:hypothetical protein
MGRNAVTTQTATPPAVYYVQPTTTGELAPCTPAEIAARRRTDRILYARWVARQAEIAEADRRARRFWLGFGAITATGLLAGGTLVGWLIYRNLAHIGNGLLTILVVHLVLLGAGALVGGSRCITTIQHRHR